MLREALHIVRNVPRGLALKARLSQVDLYEAVMDGVDSAGLGERRAALAAGLAGHVLEIGCGTGRMFPYYGEDVDLVAIEPDADFRARAAAARDRATCRIDIRDARVEALPFDDATFDAVVVALVLCSVADPAEALAEIRRVLRPGGELRIVEHVVSTGPVTGAVMRALDPLWVKVNGQGCHMARDPAPTVEAAGLTVEADERFRVFAPAVPPFPMRRLTARLQLAAPKVW